MFETLFRPSVLKRFREFMDHADAPKDYVDVHRERYVRSLAMILPEVSSDARVLEVGGRSVVADFLAQERGCDVRTVASDLRYPFAVPDASVDLVLNMEVIEHLKDRDEDNREPKARAMWTGSGIESCLRECRRVLRPGGRMFLSTPNACSEQAVLRILDGHAGYNYRPHVREYSVGEVETMCAAAGFRAVRMEVIVAWPDARVRPERVAKLRLEHPGDDILMLLER